ncbi:MAG: methionyl-tRNA formyltransferase [Acidimicrobiia bacterium]|nr:methionyl-tRNA formyltransferase [Acidimicrobiia bacterium]MYB73188.1 methionyl-tRNA formyltransferase [Acidimicrobiia bacterium]MYI00455.1 methionyl-tRNA formyltransferase [Acidimicrobiia bacterium]
MIDPPVDIRRLVYLGTPEESVPFLEALDGAGFDMALAVTRPDKRRGRRADPTPSPVKAAALDLGVPVCSEVDDVLDVEADLGVVVAFGQIIKPHVLDRLAMVNVHFSLLPRWRGAAPVERAILAGDQTTGVCLMEVAEGLDTGRVYRRVEVPIAPEATATTLRADLVDAAVPMLVSALRDGLGTPDLQQGEPVYAAKISRDELRLDWSSSAEFLNRQVRVGGAWTTWRGKTLKIWSALPVTGSHTPGELDGPVVGTGNGQLQLVEVQAEGKSRQPAEDWLRGARPTPGDRLGS